MKLTKREITALKMANIKDWEIEELEKSARRVVIFLDTGEKISKQQAKKMIGWSPFIFCFAYCFFHKSSATRLEPFGRVYFNYKESN